MSNGHLAQRRSQALACACRCEFLEPRRMLATYSGTAGNDTIAITTAAQFHRVTINGASNTTGDSSVTINALDGNDTINVTDTLTGSIIIVNGGNGDDFLQNIGRDLDDTYASFLFAGGAGADRIVADNSGDDDSGQTFRIEADRLVREGSPERFLLTYSGLEVFGYADTEFANTIRLANLQTASRDVQQLQVLGNGGNDFIRNDTSQYWGTTFGTGLAQIVGGPGNDVVDLFNTNATVPATYTMDATSVDVSSTQFNTGPVTFADCESVTIHGSAQNETFLLNAKPPGLNIRFNGSNGNDAFTVGGGDLDSNGLLTSLNSVGADGGGGSDSITFNDTLDAEGEFETCIIGASSPSVSYSLTKGPNLQFVYLGFEAQTFNAGDRVNSVSTPNEINVLAAPGGTAPTTINGGANRKCDVTIGNFFDFDTAPVTANLQGGTVGIGDNDTPRVYRLTQTQLVTPKVINYSGVDTFNIGGSFTAGDNFFIDGVASGTSIVVLGQEGDDVLTLGTGNVDATILGPVTFNSGDGSDTVVVDNSLDATVESHTLNGATFTDGQTHTFDTEALIINEGPGGTSFAVNATSCETFINGGTGNETFNVGGGDINSNFLEGPFRGLHLDGQGGNDQILFNDLNDNTLDEYHLDTLSGGDSLRRTGITGNYFIFWEEIESVTLDASNAPTFAGNPSIIFVDDLVTPLRIRGNAGSDLINLKDPVAPVFVHTGAGDADSLLVNSDFGAGDEPAVVVIDLTDDVETLDIKPGGTVRVETGAVLVKTRLNATPGLLSIAGVLDVAGGAFLSTAGGPSPATFRPMLRAGYNSGTWNGTSTGGAINSSLAAGSSLPDAIGYGLGSEIALNSIGGFNIADGDVLLRYTYYGDADLNGVVNFDDYARTDAGFLNNRTGWVNGDYDYNNLVNFDDYSLIDQAFLDQGNGRHLPTTSRTS